MVKLEWGKKRICPACGLKYYDFNKSPIICPTCSVEFDPDLYLKSRKGKNLSSKLAVAKDVAEPDEVETEVLEEVVSDEDEIVDLNKDIKNSDNETEIDDDDDISFIDEEDINGEDVISVDVVEDEKD